LKSTRILGIDPGTIALGWGVIDSNGHDSRLVEFGVVRTTPKASLHHRLLTIFEELQGIIERIRPDVMAVEEVFLGKNPRSALWIGHARAVAMLAAARQRISLAEYAAREVKMAVVGNGSASKKQVEYMVGTILRATGRIPQDAADALAVALCHSSRCTDFHLTHNQ
jgi:crossover junction endodeoxyribonuclease RuvC